MARIDQDHSVPADHRGEGEARRGRGGSRGRRGAPPPALSAEDKVFVIAFVRSHGSIKEMERVFGVSYPTIKARLNRIGESLDFVDTNPRPSRVEILDRLRRGEITPDDAVRELEELK